MSFQDRLTKLRPYVVGLRFVKETPVVDVNFKEGWQMLSRDDITISKSEKMENYYMFYSKNESFSIDDLLDFVEECIEFNKEVEDKEILLKNYVSTLKNMFKVLSYSDLKKLEFKIPTDEVIPEKVVI